MVLEIVPQTLLTRREMSHEETKGRDKIYKKKIMKHSVCAALIHAERDKDPSEEAPWERRHRDATAGGQQMAARIRQAEASSLGNKQTGMR